MTTASPECGRAGISNTCMTSPSGRDATATAAVAATAATVSLCGVLSPASAQSAASTSGTAVGHGHHLYGRPRSITARSPALSPAMDEFIGSRRGSKDSSDSATGTFLDDLVNQLTTPDYDNPHDQIARTNVFLMIYRKFLRPRDLLEMFIDRFEEQGDYVDADLDEQDLASLEARDTRLRSVSGDGDQERPVTPVPAMSYEEMDEDREWGLYDTDEELPEVRFAQQQGLANPLVPGTLTIPDSGSFANASSMDSLAPFPLLPNSGRRNSRTLAHLPRDRRSSTGSLSHGCTNSTIRESILGTRRGSASSASSHPGCYHHYQPSSGSFAEGDSTPMQLQPIGAIPIITKRSSSQAYRQRALSNASTGSIQTAGQAPSVSGTTSSNGSTSGLHSCHKTPSLNSVGPGLFEGLLPHIIHPPPPPQPSANVTSTPFMDISDEDVADQLTCVEFGLFRKLKPRDMLRQVWKSGKGSVAFQACIAHFNFISSWVGTMILAPPKVKHRAKMMEKFISIAKILRKKGNYNTTMAIVGAMNTSSIHRLVQTREMLQNKEIWTTFKELEKLMSSERSFAEYRAALKATKPPCIPYLGVHLGDLLSISEGNKDFRQDGSIHWQKFVLMSDVIMKVMEFQKVSYEIEPDPFISRIITDTHVLDDEELYTKSVDTEPNKLNHSRSLSFKLFL
ncbi:hypothetical protein BGW42_000998 [Actinomortierella wolfii]|nr:hypothetical protein BGW42_000998 [Actinomortierella wolfii]